MYQKFFLILSFIHNNYNQTYVSAIHKNLIDPTIRILPVIIIEWQEEYLLLKLFMNLKG